jgi:hemerythrin-like domain-containing protein
MLASNDALVQLKADHDKVRYLLRALAVLDSTDGDDVDVRQAELIDDICYELTIHALVEEELFYPALRAAGGNDDLLDEAEGEHDGIRELVNQLEVIYPGDEHFTATVVVFGEELRRHIEKEERDLFAAARRAGIDLAALGLRMAMRRSALEIDMTAPPLPADAACEAHEQDAVPALRDGVRRTPRAPN